ncbi:unnamed protein product [Chrysodeixis includens]|uniref:Uncharacterized protein n=1 Tax=Chrysodeixis includens TaxID=689277 RepID=A0A9P0G170_CHRIL|nr:unnamed protein product [Chrysodeixis includens]
MEELYDDLDNYNEVNCLQELRTENTELKVKLEEHATAMEKLQKQILQDYDTLASEFKQLENNYSSLLKTARSEIERKTQRITQLNKEKDMMIINAVQKGVNIKRHFNKVPQGPDPNKMPTEKPAGHEVKEGLKTKNIEAKNESREAQSKDNVPVLKPSNKSDCHKPKENPIYHKSEHPAVASSIRDRRKSTPAVPMPYDKFSSEEEFDQNNPAKSNRDIPSSSKFDRRNSNRYDRPSNRSETSSLDDRNLNYRESSRNYQDYNKDSGYKGGRPSRQYDIPHHDKNSYKRRDKYDSSSRHRKHYSPERGPRGSQKDFKDDYARHEHDRYRTPESPTREPFNRYHQRNEDRHSNFDRHAHDYDKHRSSYEQRSAPKHRMSTDYDEPHSKRLRTENFGNPDVHFKEDHHKPHHSHDSQRASAFSPDEYDNRHATCQSPDYEHFDSAVTNPKEIMASAATPLDDPRVTSKKYVIKKENGKEVLLTAVGRNVDIKPIDKIGWKFEAVDVPVALVRRPSQCSEGLVKDINCLSHDSVESGEICFDSDNERSERNKAKEVYHTENDTKISSKQDTNLDKSEKPIAKYKIPKVGQSNKKADAKLNVPVIEVDENAAKSKNVVDKVVIVDSSKKVTDKPEYKHKNISSNKVKNHKSDEDESQKQVLNNTLTAKIAIVADDLELSDENSDNVDTHKLVTEKKHIKEQLKINKTKKDESKNKISNNTNSQLDKVTETISEAVQVPVHEKSKESDSVKKQHSKKKRSKSKDSSSKDVVKHTDEMPESEKKSKTKKDKDSNESHNKFSELFGDSSSLMTPEDLGIPSYLPICENALDMKIDEMIDANTHPTSICPDVKSKTNDPAEQIITPKEVRKENKIRDVLRKSNTEEKEVSEKGHPSYSKGMISLDMYKNLNSETDANEPGVVQTVIISKGLQQQYDDSNAAIMETPASVAPLYDTNRNGPDSNRIQATISFKKQDMKALATSTPHKELTDFKIGTESAIKDFTNNSNNNLVKSPDSGAQTINQLQPTVDTQDAPDVRIFVKRRRKVVKQAPVT